MKIAIMQPYLFPYIGYWQLIHSVDIFVIYDDVNYIKGGYINRNSILNVDKSQRFTLELLALSQNKLINEIQIGRNRNKILKSIEFSYHKAPEYEKVFPLIKHILEYLENNLSKYLEYSLIAISKYLEIDTVFINSSKIKKDKTLKGEDKIIEICQKLEATDYINAIGGELLYSKNNFQCKNILLQFLETEELKYRQFKGSFVSSLSIIDVMMFNSVDEVKNILSRYQFS